MGVQLVVSSISGFLAIETLIFSIDWAEDIFLLWFIYGEIEDLSPGFLGVDILIVTLTGLGERDLNQTVLLGITLGPTSAARGLLWGMTLDSTNPDSLEICLSPP